MADNTNPDNTTKKEVSKMKNFINHEKVLTGLPTDPMLIRHVRSMLDDEGRITLTINFDFDKKNIRVNTFQGQAKPTSTYKNHYYSRSYRFPFADVESEMTEGKLHGRWTGDNLRIVGLPDEDAKLMQLMRALEKFSEIPYEKALKVIEWLDGVKDMDKRWDRINRGATTLKKYFDGNYRQAKRFMLAMDNIANRIPDYLDTLLAKVAGGTMVTVTTSGIFILKFYDEDGKVRKLGDLRAFEVEAAKKMMKRFAPLATQSYMFESWDAYRIFEEINGEIFYVNPETGEHESTENWDPAEFIDTEGVINILFAAGPEDRTLVDGVSIIAPHIIHKMVHGFVAREEDEERMYEYAAHFLGSARYNARLVIGGGTIKGDVVVAEPEVAVFDIVTWKDENYKPGLATSDGRAHMHLTPQNEYHGVRANTQSVAHFGHILNKDNILLDNMTAMRQRNAKSVMAGKAVGAVNHVRMNTLEDSELKSIMERIALWLEEEGTLNTSPHLATMNARQIERMGDVNKAHKLVRQYPTSYSVSMSVTSEYIYTLATGHVLDLTGTEFVLTKYGAIFADDEFADIMDALGGADQDDHAEFHLRRMLDKVSKFDIWAGSIAALVIRNPIGTNSDSQKVSSEYYVMRPRMSHEETAKFIRAFGELPEMAASDLPTHSSELDAAYLAQCKSITPRNPVYPHGYSFETIHTMVYDTAAAVGLYGTINLLMTFCREHNITFKLGLEPEFLIDVCEQTRDPKDLELIGKKVTYMRKKISAHVRMNKMVDMVAWDRLGLLDDVEEDPDGMITRLVNHYRAEMSLYLANARLHLRAIKDHWNEAYNNSDDKDALRAVEFLARSVVGAGFSTMAEAFKNAEGTEIVARYMLSTLNKNEANNDKVKAQYDWILANTHRSIKAGRMAVEVKGRRFSMDMFNPIMVENDQTLGGYSNTDQVFVAMAMIRRYLKALETNRDLRVALLPFDNKDLHGWDEEVLARGFDPESYEDEDDNEIELEDN